MSKKFVWCVQGPGEYEHLEAMRSDRSDALALSFKEQIDGYLYGPGTTHTTGRNMLYDAVKDGGYEYICFADDDAFFEGMSHADGFRKFERLVDEFNPAIASPRYAWHLREHTDLSARVQGLIALDICVNAYHRSVWPVLFPMWSEFDHKSWWNAAHVLNRIAAVLWTGGAVQFNEIHLINPRNGAYPRQDRCRSADEMINDMLKPGMKHLQWPHETPESLRPVAPLLRNDYAVTRDEVGRYFDLTHQYWLNRL